MPRTTVAIRVLSNRVVAAAIAVAVHAAPVLLIPAATAQPLPNDTSETLRRVVVRSPDAPALARELDRSGYDVVRGRARATAFEMVVSVRELDALRRRGLTIDVVERGRPFREIMAARGGEPSDVPRGYPDLDAVHAAMSDAAAVHPAICAVVDLTATYGVPATFEGRHQLVVKISGNVGLEEDEPAVLLVSAHHCRELVTPVIGLDVIERLTDGYGVDPAITAVVDANEIWIAPVWNPDGYEHVFDTDNLWRKNRRVFPSAIGVDLNRNYPFGWSSPCSGSTNPDSNNYKGPDPASEAETQTLIALSNDRRFAKVLDFHSQGRIVLWGYDCIAHPFDAFLEQEAEIISGLADYGGPATPSADGEHYQWQLGVHGAHAFLVETQVMWQPEYQDALDEAERVWPGILWMLARPIPLTGLVTDAATGDAVNATITLPGETFLGGETFASGGPFGRYHLFLPPGDHALHFDAPNYVPETRMVSVPDGAGSTLDVALNERRIAFSFPDGVPTVVPPVGGVVAVRIEELVPGGLVPGSATLHFDDGGGFTTAPLVSAGGDLYDASFPPSACGSALAFFFSAEIDTGPMQTSPDHAPATTYGATSAYETIVVFEDDGESDPGWTVENVDLSDGAWERGVPLGGGDRGDPRSDFDGSGRCWLTDPADGNSDVDGGPTRLISPALDLEDAVAPIARYARWFTSSDPDDDVLEVEISVDDGASWSPVETVPDSPGWIVHAFRVADLVTPSAATRLRFSVADDQGGSVTEAAIDAVSLASFTCTPTGDVDGDGDVDFGDLLGLLASWSACPPPPAACPADLDGDGDVDFEDLLILLANWTG